MLYFLWQAVQKRWRILLDEYRGFDRNRIYLETNLTGVNISQKNWNYSVMGLRKFQNYSELLKIILSNKVQNLCFGIIFVDFWGQFLVSKRNINLILVKFDINVDFLRKNSEKSLEFQKLFRKQSSRILRNIYPPGIFWATFWLTEIATR